MIGVLEAAGYAIVGGTFAQAMVALYGTVQRRAEQARRARDEIQLFRERARLLLEAEQAERARTELSWNGNRKFVIDRKVMEAKDVCSFYLVPHDRNQLPPFLPGQYLTFTLHVPGQPKPVIRCYSLSDSPDQRDYYRVTIKRLDPPPKEPDAPPGLSSNYFHRELAEGDILDVKAPSGHFHLDQASNSPVVLIGGGVGLTPVLSMLNSIVRSDSRREVWFFYGVTNRSDHAMYDHLAAIRSQHDNVNIVVCYSRPSETCVEGTDYDHAGFVSVELFKQLLPSNNYEFYICGPPPMMEAVTRDLAEWGVPEGSVNFEAFGPATVKKAPKAAASETAEAGAEGGIEIVFDSAGKTVQWNESAGSILDCAEANGVAIDSGCRAGNCGTCLTAIKDGEVSYLCEPGYQPEAGSCLACIAVPTKRLVLDT